MSQEALDTLAIKNNFYRDGYNRMKIICMLLIFLSMSLCVLAYILGSSCPTPAYFATTSSGEIMKLEPLSRPNMSTNNLLQWATQAATSAYTYNFVNYKEALNAVRGNFTAVGYQNFIQALTDANNLTTVIDKKLIVSAVPTNTPVIIKEGIAGSNYAWLIQLPLLISYQSANESSRQEITVTMLITRLSTLDSPDGIGIAQFVVAEGSNAGRG
jgi:intracellular multiplication protein IcmL